MNKIWTIISLISVSVLFYTEPQNVLTYMNDAATNSVTLMLKLAALYTVWMGLLNIAERAGITKWVAKALKPVIRFLFGNVSDETSGHISLNMSANILGIGAATPAGILAINSMDKGNETATPNMIMLLVLNATSLQLLPTTVISLRQTFGSGAPSNIIIPTILTSLTSALFAVLLVKIIQAKPAKKSEVKPKQKQASASLATRKG